MAKHTPGEKKVYTSEFFQNTSGTVLDNILKVMDAAKSSIEGRWIRTQTAFEMAVKYHDTPTGPELLDNLINRVAEELWCKSYKLHFFENRDDRKACSVATEIVNQFRGKMC
jgi:hypothetical protein